MQILTQEVPDPAFLTDYQAVLPVHTLSSKGPEQWFSNLTACKNHMGA